ncbi:MAG: FtsQ-type POTRA domain-containing protein [Candidatus Moranbacteria bacterium]|nr:FtsQ-type POTRA domain-containing protein [Candidatus Moranbacteria bacterium]
MGHFLLWMATVLYGGVVLYVLFWSGLLSVKEIVIEGADRVSEEAIEKIIKDSISRSYVNILSKDNILIAPSKEIEEKIKQEIKKIATVQVVTVFPDKMIIMITERKNVIIICNANNKDICWVINEDATAQGKFSPQEESIEQDEKIVVVSQKEIEEGGQTIGQDDINFLSEFHTGLRRQLHEKKVDYYEIGEPGSNEIIVYLKTGERIATSNKLSPKRTAKNIHIVIEKSQREYPGQEVEYIDARFMEKIFFRLKGWEEEVVEQEEDDEEGQDKDLQKE